MRLVRQGRVFDLAHVLHADIPAFPGRTFRQYLTTNAHQVNRRRPDAGPDGWGRNNVNWVVEQVTATQQMGTHLDALNHLQVGDRTYNGYRLADIAEEYGTNRLGVDTLPQVVTRGLLLDIAAVRGVERLRARRRHHARGRRGALRAQRPRGPARRRRAVPHRLGLAVGRRQRPVRRAASPGRAWSWPSGWSTSGSP